MKKQYQGEKQETQELSGLERTVGQRIREKRNSRGWTQKKLANELGISYQQVQKYETGINRVSAGRLFQISHLLGVDIRTFFERPDTGARAQKASVKSPTVRLEGDLLTEDVQAALNNLVRALAKRVH